MKEIERERERRKKKKRKREEGMLVWGRSQRFDRHAIPFFLSVPAFPPIDFLGIPTGMSHRPKGIFVTM